MASETQMVDLKNEEAERSDQADGITSLEADQSIFEKMNGLLSTMETEITDMRNLDSDRHDLSFHIGIVRTRLRHWRSSILFIASKFENTQSEYSSAEHDEVIKKFLDEVDHQNLFLSSIIKRHMDSIEDNLTMLSGWIKDEAETLPGEDFMDELNLSLKYLGLQLEPLSTFACMRSDVEAASDSPSTLLRTFPLAPRGSSESAILTSKDRSAEKASKFEEVNLPNERTLQQSKAEPKTYSLRNTETHRQGTYDGFGPTIRVWPSKQLGHEEVAQGSVAKEEGLFARVSKGYVGDFFICGRVFKMLWTEPAGHVNPGLTGNSPHLSTVWLGEQAFSEIRYFVVVRNKGTFSQCVSINTHRGRGATGTNLVMKDHGIIYTTESPPKCLLGESFTKSPIRVVSSNRWERLDLISRVNYGKPYVVEHGAKVKDFGVVIPEHRHLLVEYFADAMCGAYRRDE